VTLSAREHYAAASSARVVVVLETDIDDELRREGLARELVNRIQTMRKELDLDYADRIRVTLDGDAVLDAVIAEHGNLLRVETLATSLERGTPETAASVKETDCDGISVRIGLVREG
jgi:isoleucyl-tRNA synthetase